MTYFDDSKSLKDPMLESNERNRILSDRIRRFTLALLEDGANPPDTSYYLAYISTEMGLRLTTNSYKVFPMALAGIVDAGRDAIHLDSIETDAEETRPETEIVDGDTPNAVTH